MIVVNQYQIVMVVVMVVVDENQCVVLEVLEMPEVANYLVARGQ
jgi:hypothetical protein